MNKLIARIRRRATCRPSKTAKPVAIVYAYDVATADGRLWPVTGKERYALAKAGAITSEAFNAARLGWFIFYSDGTAKRTKAPREALEQRLPEHDGVPVYDLAGALAWHEPPVMAEVVAADDESDVIAVHFSLSRPRDGYRPLAESIVSDALYGSVENAADVNVIAYDHLQDEDVSESVMFCMADALANGIEFEPDELGEIQPTEDNIAAMAESLPWPREAVDHFRAVAEFRRAMAEEDWRDWEAAGHDPARLYGAPSIL